MAAPGPVHLPGEQGTCWGCSLFLPLVVWPENPCSPRWGRQSLHTCFRPLGPLCRLGCLGPLTRETDKELAQPWASEWDFRVPRASGGTGSVDTPRDTHIPLCSRAQPRREAAGGTHAAWPCHLVGVRLLALGWPCPDCCRRLGSALADRSCSLRQIRHTETCQSMPAVTWHTHMSWNLGGIQVPLPAEGFCRCQAAWLHVRVSLSPPHSQTSYSAHYIAIICRSFWP